MHTTKLLVSIAALSFVGLALATSKGDCIKKKRPQIRRHNDNVMNKEDTVFWTRLLQDGGRGKETELMSLPPIPRPPSALNSGDTGQVSVNIV